MWYHLFASKIHKNTNCPCPYDKVFVIQEAEKIIPVFSFIPFFHLRQEFKARIGDNFHAHNFIIEYLFIGHMIRCRYWHLSIDELKKVTYDPKKVLVWERSEEHTSELQSQPNLGRR